MNLFRYHLCMCRLCISNVSLVQERCVEIKLRKATVLSFSKMDIMCLKEKGFYSYCWRFTSIQNHCNFLCKWEKEFKTQLCFFCFVKQCKLTGFTTFIFSLNLDLLIVHTVIAFVTTFLIHQRKCLSSRNCYSNSTCIVILLSPTINCVKWSSPSPPRK